MNIQNISKSGKKQILDMMKNLYECGSVDKFDLTHGAESGYCRMTKILLENKLIGEISRDYYITDKGMEFFETLNQEKMN